MSLNFSCDRVAEEALCGWTFMLISRFHTFIHKFALFIERTKGLSNTRESYKSYILWRLYLTRIDVPFFAAAVYALNTFITEILMLSQLPNIWSSTVISGWFMFSEKTVKFSIEFLIVCRHKTRKCPEHSSFSGEIEGYFFNVVQLLDY